jgi:hypothetical protein
VLQARLDIVGGFMGMLLLIAEDQETEAPEWAPNGVAAVADGVIAVLVATDVGPVRAVVEVHDAEPPRGPLADGEDMAVLTWRPLGKRARLYDQNFSELGKWLALPAGRDLLGAEVRCRGREVAGAAGVGGVRGEPVEEVEIRLWPVDQAPEELVVHGSGYFEYEGQPLPDPGTGPVRELAPGDRALVPMAYHAVWLHDEGVPLPPDWLGTMRARAARVNGLVSNLPGVVLLKVGAQIGTVDLGVHLVEGDGSVAAALAVLSAGPLPKAADAVAVAHTTSGTVRVCDKDGGPDLCCFCLPAGRVGLLVVAWDRDGANRRRRKPVPPERVDVVFWTSDVPDEVVLQGASNFGRKVAADDVSIREQLEDRAALFGE